MLVPVVVPLPSLGCSGAGCTGRFGVDLLRAASMLASPEPSTSISADEAMPLPPTMGAVAAALFGGAEGARPLPLPLELAAALPDAGADEAKPLPPTCDGGALCSRRTQDLLFNETFRVDPLIRPPNESSSSGARAGAGIALGGVSVCLVFGH